MAALIPWRALCECTLVAFDAASDNIAARFENFLRRGGVGIVTAHPHKSGPPNEPCPTRTGFSRKSQNEALHSTVLT